MAPRELSVFVDESGDVGSLQAHSPFYILGLVFHDQSYSISSNVQIIRTKLVQRGFSQNHAIHTAPLIRGEYEYEWLKLDKRRALFRDLFHFFRSCKVRQRTLLLNKQTVGHGADLLAALATELSNVISNNLTYFLPWDKIIIYYDYGQTEIAKLVEDAFNARCSNVEIRNIQPTSYSLFQAADLCCTLALLRKKIDDPTMKLTKSESAFFVTAKSSAVSSLRKVYFKPLDKIEL